MSEMRLAREGFPGYIHSVTESITLGLKGAKNEVLRKAIHFLIGFCPLIAAWNLYSAEIFLLCGCVAYAGFESLRVRGIRVPVVSALTHMASRPRDADRFVMGPITLGLGAFLALALFPPQIAAIAIYALAFGDGFASLVGKLCGRIRPGFLRGKSVEGSLACFTAVLITAYAVSQNIGVSIAAAVTASVIEAFPLGDYDNIALPVAVGFVIMFV